ncbi:hypothetical protein [Staphylococcus capitis]|uniref:hypothetical protein n=1 Tax=Staphylococcus capitis TaxID=29388 RepID=UPI001D14E9A3|nr:hypothetical protein [Staphylococcus capitis]MCC3691406.1 hypothetical protein [Staphylococcus capitis]MCC3696019.1 hypothetical protein [Staphylococcus capitis]MCC9111989.1 hypothetical protein [Staphylococcus capitis]MDH9600530.1 hypothetical protein [Staphylococcus capitis]MDH9624461.1 hypothetical protein [Staphylococcus capitis]
MAEVTKEQLLEFIRNNDLDWDESYPRSDWWKFRNERDSYRKQRDELINDMAEVKRKAKAFDEIVNAVDESANSYELVARIKLEVLKYQKLERGSDENQ